MALSKQLTFDFGSLNGGIYIDADFIVTNANLDAYNLLNNYERWPNHRLIIIGEEGSGKTHLSSIWAKAVDAHKITNYNFENFHTHKSCVLLENIDHINNEEFIFHIINHCFDEKIALLMTASELKPFYLKDLQSRLNATYKAIIKKPDDELIKVILMKHFSDRRIIPTQEILDYILMHTDRSYKFIKNFVAQIDRYAFSTKRKITINLIKEVIEKNEHA